MERALAALAELSPEVARATRVEEVLELISRRAAALVGVGRCAVFLREQHRDLFRGSAGCCDGGPLPEDVSRWVAGVAADGVTREVLRTGRPAIVANARQDPRTVKATVRHWGICSLLAVPMRFGGAVVGLLVLDDAGRRHEFSEEEAALAGAFADHAAAALAQARVRLELQAKLDASCRQLQAQRRGSAVDERLSELVLAGRPLQELLDCLAELLGKPCAVFGPVGERVGLALPEGAAEGAAPRLLEPQLAAHPDVRRALAEHDGNRAFVVGPLPAAGLLHRHVVAPVLLGEELWGRLVAMEHKARFTGGDLVALRRAATLLALQVTAERRAAEADWNAGSALATELLTLVKPGARVRRRAERLGFSLEARRAVLLLGPRSGRAEEVPDLADLAAALARELPEMEAEVAAVPGAAAALLAVPDHADPEAFVAARRPALEAVRAALGEQNLLAAVSAARRGPDGYRAALREARQVLDCLRAFSPPAGPPLFTAEELGVGGMLLAGADAETVVAFAEETVGQLARDPAKHDLLLTLRVFFDCVGSVREAAAALEVHENTVRYRLARVEEMTGLAVSHDTDAQLRARVSLLVLRLQGRLPDLLWGSPQAQPAPAGGERRRVARC